MQTMVDIDGGLLAQAEQMAAQTDRTVDAVITDALQRIVAESTVTRSKEEQLLGDDG